MIVKVYLITNRITDKQYVGITSKLVRERWSRHVYAAKNGDTCRLARAIRKYGKGAFGWKILRKVDSAKEALKLETKLIKKYETLWPSGYNTVAIGGGSWGYKYSEESKRRISESCMGRIPWNKGKKTGFLGTDETRRKRSENAKGRIPWNKGIPATFEHKVKLSKAQMTRYKNPKERARTGKIASDFWRTHPNVRKRMGKKIAEIRKRHFWSSCL